MEPKRPPSAAVSRVVPRKVLLEPREAPLAEKETLGHGDRSEIVVEMIIRIVIIVDIYEAFANHQALHVINPGEVLLLLQLFLRGRT